MKKINILTGYSNIGGSTIAHINLCNLFNENGYDCTLYGPHDWHLDKCKSDKIDRCTIKEDDITIVHFLHQLKKRLPCRKTILSCHESDVMVLKNYGISAESFDGIHYVSQEQADFQGIPGFIIPNSVEVVKKSKIKRNCAGIIGSIDNNKRTHLAIQMAQKEFKKVRLYGNLTDPGYFMANVLPLLSEDVVYCGATSDKKAMYDSIDKVFHASLKETFNLVKAECQLANIPYEEQPSRPQEIWEDPKILRHWEKVFSD